MIIYNYLTTNLINGKQYIGMHSSINVDDNYLGSGFIMLKAIKKWGRLNFKREILCICKSLKEANENETKFIEQYNTLYPKGYNLSPTGGLGFKGCHSKETKEKMMGNKNAKGTIPSKETREKIRQSKIGNTWGFQKGHKIMVGKKLSDETKDKMSKSKVGKRWTLSEETKKKLSVLRKGRDVSWCIGKPRSEEIRKKISETKKRQFELLKYIA